MMLIWWLFQKQVVAAEVMDEVGVLPEPDLLEEDAPPKAEGAAGEQLDVFSDFLDTLDFDDFEE